MSTIEYRVIGEKEEPELVTFAIRVRLGEIPEGMEPKPARKELDEKVEGDVVAQSTNNDTAFAPALSRLVFSGYELIQSYYEKKWELVEKPTARTLKKYAVLSFVFARSDRGQFLDQCLEMLTGSLWLVRVWKNKLFRDGQPVPGKYTLSVNCTMGQRLYNDDGSPAGQWHPLIVDGEQYTETRVVSKREEDPLSDWEDGGDERADVFADVKYENMYEVKVRLMPGSELRFDGNCVSITPAH